MQEDLENQLLNKYPRIFQERLDGLSPQESCMYWGLDVGDGWYNIIDRLCASIILHEQNVEQNCQSRWEYVKIQAQNMFQSYPSQRGPRVFRLRWWKLFLPSLIRALNKTINDKLNQFHPVVAEQVKEKYGTLRFYYRGGDKYVSGLVTMAESMSGRTCEICGAPGRVEQSGWLSCRCDTHRKEISTTVKIG